MAHDGSEGLSPDGWLPDRISVGVLARVFTPELVDAAVDAAGAREQRRRLLPARLVMYFVLALWLFRGRNCGYGQVMTKLADGLYHQRRAGDLLDGQQMDPGGWVDAGQGRRWRQPNISSLSRGRGKLGPAPVRFLFEQVAGPIGEEGAPGVFCCGHRVVSIDGSTSDVPDEQPNAAHFGRPSNQARDGAFPQVRWLAAAESGTGSLLGASLGPYRDSEQALARDLLETGCFGPGMLVLADRKFLSWALAREFLATGAHILWRASAAFTLKPVKVLADGTYLAELKPPRKTPQGFDLSNRVHPGLFAMKSCQGTLTLPAGHVPDGPAVCGRGSLSSGHAALSASGVSARWDHAVASSYSRPVFRHPCRMPTRRLATRRIASSWPVSRARRSS